MQIKVEYLPVGSLPPKITILNTPWTKDWERVECEIKSTEGDLEPKVERDHLWTIYVDQITREKIEIGNPGDGIKIKEILEKCEYHHDPERILKHTCSTAEDYIAWLEETVMCVVIDGVVFWENVAYQKAKEKAREEAEAAADDDSVLVELFRV